MPVGDSREVHFILNYEGIDTELASRNVLLDYDGPAAAVSPGGLDGLVILLFCIKTVVANSSSDGEIIFLFNKAVVIFSVWTCPSKRDVMIIAPAPQLMIDELTPVIAVNALQEEGKLLADAFGLLFYPPVCTILQRAQFNPS